MQLRRAAAIRPIRRDPADHLARRRADRRSSSTAADPTTDPRALRPVFVPFVFDHPARPA